MKVIIDLPETLIRVIQSYLTKDDYHYFMNTSKTHFTDIKKQTIYYDLEYGKSLEYILNPDFQELLLSKVTNGWKQIGLRLKESVEERIPLTLPINKIIIKQSTLSDLDYFKHIQHVIGVKVHDSVPPIPHITELTIKNSLQLKNIEHLSHLNTLKILHRNKLKDLTPLRNIENILIQECRRVRDFSMFHSDRQRSLRLFYCPYLTNLENFRMIRCVVISDCESIEDVSPLYGVYDLSLICCYSLKDISGLGYHHRLNLEGCHYIKKGFKSLFNIPYISFYSSLLKDLTPLRAAKSVTLRRCDEVVDISPLVRVSTVIIQNCRLIIDPTPLLNIPNLSLMYGDMDYCQINYTQLANLKNHSLTLSLYLTNTIKEDNSNDYQFFRHIQHLTITGNTLIDVNMDVFNFIHHLQSITIIDCNIKHVNGFNKIPKVFLKGCHELKDITGLGNNHSVDLRYCEKVKRVDNLTTIPIVTIIGCAGIEDYSSLKNVPRLKILRTGGEEEDGNEDEVGESFDETELIDEEDDDEGDYDEGDDEGNDGEESDDF